MLRLSTFGGLAVEADPAARPGLDDRARQALAELVRRRRKLLLLVLLVRSPRPLSRDLLVDWFWPDDEPERGRHSLNEALSHLRRVLGAEALGSRGADVALAPGHGIRSDVADLAAAVARQDHATVVALYAGPFLDGIFADRAPRLEAWIAREREQWRRAFVAACAAICRTPLDPAAADARADVARRWLDAEPASGEAARAWIEALAAGGTRAALTRALAAAAAHERELGEAFGVGPEPAEVALVATLRARLDALAPEPALAAAPPATPASDAAPPPVAAPASPPVPASPAVPAGWRPSRGGVALLGLVAVAILAAGTRAIMAARAGGAASARPWIYVMPTRGTGDGIDSALTATLSVALGTAVAADESVDVLSDARRDDVLRQMQRPPAPVADEATALEVATRTGVSVVVAPAVLRLGTAYTLSARVLAPDRGAPLAVVTRRAASDTGLLDAIDALAEDIRRAVRRGAPAMAPRAPLPSATTGSLDALRLYAAALAAQERKAWDTARVRYRDAVRADSQFALAWMGLGVLEYQLNRPIAGESAFAPALRLAGRVSPREQLVLRHRAYRWRRQADSAIALLTAWLATRPDDRGAQEDLAYDLFLARRHQDARVAYRRLLERDPRNAQAWINLAATCNAIGDSAALTEAQAAFRRGFQLWPAGGRDVTLNHEWGVAFARAGLGDSARRIYELMREGPPASQARGARSLGHLAVWEGRFREAATHFAEAVRLERGGGRALSVLRAQLLLAQAAELAGDAALARAQRDSARRTAADPDVQEPTVLYWTGKALARQGDVAAAVAVWQLLRARMRPENPRHVAAERLLAGEVDLARGRVAPAIVAIDSGVSLDRSAITLESQAHAAALQATRTMAGGDRTRAIAHYEALAQAPTFGWEGTVGQLTAPLVAARLHEAGGDRSRARALYQAVVDRWPRGDTTAVPVRAAREGLARTGR